MRGAAFIDLDGTLTSGNSLHIFIKLLPRLLLRRRLPAVPAALWWTALRSLRLASHRTMKWHITRIARRHLTEEDWEAIALRISGRTNPAVKAYADSRKDRGCAVFIATGAPEEYALPLSRLMGFDGALATQFADSKHDYDELRGNLKRDAIQAKLSNEGMRLESFLTDHTDDLPTAREFPNLTILVNPDKKTAHTFREVGTTRYICNDKL